MDQQQQNPMQATPKGVTPRGEKSVGALIGSIIIIAIIVIGGIYFWSIQEDDQTANTLNTVNQEVIVPDEKTDMLMKQSSSDEISSIEADLNSTDLNNLDAELNMIEAELQ